VRKIRLSGGWSRLNQERCGDARQDDNAALPVNDTNSRVRAVSEALRGRRYPSPDFAFGVDVQLVTAEHPSVRTNDLEHEPQCRSSNTPAVSIDRLC
jgi:hypothetical protein